jgi:hypothetical protein
MARVQFLAPYEKISGRMGNVVNTHSAGGESLIREFKSPRNPRSPKQVAARQRFTVAQSLYRLGYDNYNVLTGVTAAVLGDYVSAVLKYRGANPIAKKAFAVGFVSGEVLARPFNISHSLSQDLLVARLADGQLQNRGTAAIELLQWDVNGNGSAAPLAPEATLTPAAGTVAITLFKAGSGLPLTFTDLIAQGGMIKSSTQVIVLAAIGISE